ncbi:MAG: twin-arginine translocation pathway signal protein [Mangrovicoccus sp.]
MSDSKDATRRDILKLAASTAPIAAVALASSGTSAEAAEPDIASDKMQDTAHIRAYFETARF